MTVPWRMTSNFQRTFLQVGNAFVMIRVGFLEALSSLAMKRLCLLISSWNLFLEIHASILCKRDFRVNWWNTSLLTSKFQVLQTRAWWTPRLSFETRVLYARLAFGVHDLENFKSVLLRSLDANVASSASWSFRRGSLIVRIWSNFRKFYDSCLSLIYVLRLNYQTRV